MIESMIWGIGLVLVIEGLVYVLAPEFVERMLTALRELPIAQRRVFGITMSLLGTVLLYLAKYL